MLSLLSDTALDHLPRGCTSHIIHKSKKCTRSFSNRPVWLGIFSLLRSPISKCVKSTKSQPAQLVTVALACGCGGLCNCSALISHSGGRLTSESPVYSDPCTLDPLSFQPPFLIHAVSTSQVLLLPRCLLCAGSLQLSWEGASTNRSTSQSFRDGPCPTLLYSPVQGKHQVSAQYTSPE